MGMLEEMLSEDWDVAALVARNNGGQGVRGAQDVLRQRRAALKAQLDRGVSPEEFKKGQALLESFDAAVSGLELALQNRIGRQS
jgi:hypothetical protein